MYMSQVVVVYGLTSASGMYTSMVCIRQWYVYVSGMYVYVSGMYVYVQNPIREW